MNTPPALLDAAHSRRALLLSLPLALAACGPAKVRRRKGNVAAMGDRLTAGPLTYTILEAEWQSVLGVAPTVRVAKHRFLLLRLTITNGGGSAASAPFLILTNDNEESFSEEQQGDGVPEWLGLIRSIEPGGTEVGRVVFDVPQTAYVAIVTDGNLDNEHKAMVEIPLRMG